jgi:hypothetical protein
LREEPLQFGLSKERPLFFDRGRIEMCFFREKAMVGKARRKEKADHPRCQDLAHHEISPESPGK